MAARGSTRPATAIGVLTTLGAAACTNDDVCEGRRSFEPPPAPEPSPTAPPEVLAGEWIGSGVLELSFSKPLMSSAAPDPSRFALMSWSALASSYYGYSGSDACRQQTQYSQFGGPSYYYYYQQNAGVADVWIAPEDASILRLRISSAGTTCPTPNGLIEAGLMLVYTNGDDPSVERPRLLDENGDPVPALGPSWAVSAWDNCALQPYSYSCGFALNAVYQGHLPLTDTLAPIPCP